MLTLRAKKHSSLKTNDEILIHVSMIWKSNNDAWLTTKLFENMLRKTNEKRDYLIWWYAWCLSFFDVDDMNRECYDFDMKMMRLKRILHAIKLNELWATQRLETWHLLLDWQMNSRMFFEWCDKIASILRFEKCVWKREKKNSIRIDCDVNRLIENLIYENS